MRLSLEPDVAPLDVSEDLVNLPTYKSAGTTTIDFDGLLQPPLKLHEDLKGGCGGQLWPAGKVLGKYLLRDSQIDYLRSKKIIELGAGGGLVGLAVALALKHDSNTKIEITDQMPMFELIRQNIELNDLPSSLVEASILDWGNMEEAHGQPDIILAAECVYFEPAFPLLLATMKQLLGPHTICYFCFKKRRRADLRFVKEAKKIFNVLDIMDDPDRDVWSRENLFMYKITRKGE